MCVKIIRDDRETKYDINKPLEDQITGAKQIVVNYEPNDSSINKFLGEIERFCQTGISRTFNIKVNHNNSVLGAKIKGRMKQYAKDLCLNEVIKTLVTSYDETDKKLEEMSVLCNSTGNKNE